MRAWWPALPGMLFGGCILTAPNPAFDAVGATASGASTGPDTTATSTSLSTPTTTVDPPDLTTTGATTLDPPDPTTTGDPGPTTEPVDTDDTGVAGWWDPRWKKRRKLTFKYGGAALTDFPVGLILDPAAGRVFYGEHLPGGEDLRFVDADDATELAREVERWGGADDLPSYVWTRVPELAGGEDFIWMYWDAEAPPPPALEPTAVWSSKYAAVFHMAATPNDAEKAPDATGLHPGIYVGALAAEDVVNGRFGPALDFDGVDDMIVLEPGPNTDDWDAFTLEAWVFHRNNNNEYVLGRAAGPEPENHVFSIDVDHNHMRLRLFNDKARELKTEDDEFPQSTWTHIAFTFDAGAMRLFVDGGERLSTGSGGGTLRDMVQAIALGNINNDGVTDRYFDGMLDELRISRVARDGAWMGASHRAMVDDLVAFGEVEALP